MKNHYFLTVVFLAIACAPKPEKQGQDQNQRVQVEPNSKYPAIWIYTSGSSLGKLDRLDLTSGEIRKNLKTVGVDVEIEPVRDPRDSNLRLGVMHRSSEDAFETIDSNGGSSGKMELTHGFNPYSVTRDGDGRFWVVGYESPSVHIFNAAMNKEIGAVDLSSLAESGSMVPELNQVFYSKELDRVLVSAQRISRSRDKYVPDELGGFAWIDPQKRTVEQTKLMPYSNPNKFFVKPTTKEIVVFGSGDLSLSEKSRGSSWGMISGSPKGLKGRVLDSAQCFDEDSSSSFAFIQWFPDEKKTCLYYVSVDEEKEVFCAEGGDGYLLRRVACAGVMIAVAYVDASESQLRVWNRKTDTLQRHSVVQTIRSLSPGP